MCSMLVLKHVQLLSPTYTAGCGSRWWMAQFTKAWNCNDKSFLSKKHSLVLLEWKSFAHLYHNVPIVGGSFVNSPHLYIAAIRNTHYDSGWWKAQRNLAERGKGAALSIPTWIIYIYVRYPSYSLLLACLNVVCDARTCSLQGRPHAVMSVSFPTKRELSIPCVGKHVMDCSCFGCSATLPTFGYIGAVADTLVLDINICTSITVRICYVHVCCVPFHPTMPGGSPWLVRLLLVVCCVFVTKWVRS